MEDLDSRRWGIRVVEEMGRCSGAGVFLDSAYDGDVSHFFGTIPGPLGTTYEGQLLHLDINIPDDYPLSAPAMRFITPIEHPSVKPDGSFWLKVFDTWTPKDEIMKVLVSLTSLLSSPVGKISDSDGDRRIAYMKEILLGTTDEDESNPTRLLSSPVGTPSDSDVDRAIAHVKEILFGLYGATDQDESNPTRHNVSDCERIYMEEMSASDKIAQERLPDANCENAQPYGLHIGTIEGGFVSDSGGTFLEYGMSTPGQNNSAYKTVGQEDTRHDPQDSHRPVNGISEKDNTPAKVFKTLEDSLYNNVVTWQDDGHSFRVENQSLLEKKLLHVKDNLFKFKSYGALVRHLVDIYGFTVSKGEDGKWHFRHPSFTQKNRDVAVNMTKQNAAKVSNKITVKGLQVQINAVRNDFGRLEAKVDESAETQKSDSKKLDQLLEAVVGKQHGKPGEGSQGTNEAVEK